MSNAEAMQERLAFMGLDAETRTSLSSSRSTIEAALPAALDAFYRQVSRFPEVARFFSGEAQISGAKNAQARHWSNIASARFDDEYAGSV